MDRRQFVGSCSSALAAAFALQPGTAHAQSSSNAVDEILDEVLSEIEASAGRARETLKERSFVAPDRSIMKLFGVQDDFESPPITPEAIAQLSGRDYWSEAVATRMSVAWPASDRAPDYEHLSLFGSTPDTFFLSPSILETLADRNSFKLDRSRPVILFGLRGCSLVGSARSADWAPGHNLKVVEPSHVDSHCVMGVWRQADNLLAVFQASTVPAVSAMYMDLVNQGAGTSLLPTGLYSYRLGTHRKSKPTRIQRAALINQERYVVLRTAKELVLDPWAKTTIWTEGSVHNIHAGGGATKFSCAGCQVIPGGYQSKDRAKATGNWLTFQQAAGLADATGTPLPDDARSRFQYMLLTGREGCIAYHGGPAFENGYYRLRHGSSGPKVARVQKSLLSQRADSLPGLIENGQFDIKTSFGVLLTKKLDAGEYRSPIVSI